MGRARPRRIYSSRVYFSDYADSTAETEFVRFTEADPRSAFTLHFRYSRQGRLAVVNGGVAGRGFWICQRCGYAQPVVQGNKPKLKAHRSPYGRQCNGLREMRHLGHEFLTDVLELRFIGPPRTDAHNSLWWSLTYALLEGASQELGIERDDIDGCLYAYGPAGQAPAIILYDGIPGGAGHVRRVADSLPAVLREAHNRVASCRSCEPDTACYTCLKTYDNQFCHHLLARGPAMEFLASLISVS